MLNKLVVCRVFVTKYLLKIAAWYVRKIKVDVYFVEIFALLILITGWANRKF